MKWTALLLWLMVFQVTAQAGPRCNETNLFYNDEIAVLLDELNSINKNIELPWDAATDRDVKNRACKKKVPNLSAIEKELASFSDGVNKQSKAIIGVKFKDESKAMLDAFEDLVVKKDYLGNIMRSAPVDDYKINPTCTKVQCAVEKIFGKELGNKILYLKTKYGFNGSEFVFGDSDRLNLNEVNSLISAVEAYPLGIFPLDQNRQLTKFNRGYTLALHDEGVMAYAAITFYDLWSDQSFERREYIAFHELAHEIGSELSLDDNPQWLSFSGWIEKDEKWSSSKKDTFSSEYGATNPAEDFAESVSSYRYNPAILKLKSPEKYQYIKETVFDGLEYSSSGQCQITKSYGFKLKNSKKKNSSIKRDQDQIISFIKICDREVSKYLINRPDSLSELDQCLMEVENRSKMVSDVDGLNLKYPKMVKARLLATKPLIKEKISRDPKREFSDIKKYLKDEFVKGIVDRSKGTYFYNDSNHLKTCNDTWKEYGYLFLFSDDKQLKDTIDTYEDRDDFNRFLVKLCLDINKDKGKSEVYTTDDVKNTLDYFVLTSQKQKDKYLQKLIDLEKQQKKIIDEFENLFILKKYKVQSIFEKEKNKNSEEIMRLKALLY